MRRVVPVFVAELMALTSVQAEAKRIGGGGSMGRQSSLVTQRQSMPAQRPQAPTQNATNNQAAAQQQANRPANTNTPAAQTRRPWAGILGGLAAGLGLAWLANSLGFGEGFGNMMLILLAVMAAVFVFRMLRGARRTGNAAPFQQQPATVGGYNPQNVGNDASARPWEAQQTPFQAQPSQTGGSMIGSGIAGGAAAASALSGSQNWGVPAGFDTNGFLAAAKRNFVTLQDAWDRGDVSSLRSMMTDGMLVEIQQQLAERQAQGGAPNKTDVDQLQAQLLGIEEGASDYLASVEFSGMIREDAATGFVPFREVWNMSKSKAGGAGWLVAGVQSL